MVLVQRDRFVKDIYSVEHVKCKENYSVGSFLSLHFYGQGLKEKKLEEYKYILLAHGTDGYAYIIPYDDYAVGYDALREVEDSQKLLIQSEDIVLKFLDKYCEEYFELYKKG